MAICSGGMIDSGRRPGRQRVPGNVSRGAMASEKGSQQTKSRRAKQTANGPGPDRKTEEHALPDRETALEMLHKMQLIRRFEERAQEMYMKARIGGFLHLAIGEEATIVGVTSVLQDQD